MVIIIINFKDEMKLNKHYNEWEIKLIIKPKTKVS